MDYFIIMLNVIYLCFVVSYIFKQKRIIGEFDNKIVVFGELLLLLSSIVLIFQYNITSTAEIIQNLILLSLIYLGYQILHLQYPNYEHFDKTEFYKSTIVQSIILILIYGLMYRVLDRNMVVVSLPEPIISRSILFVWLFLISIVLIIFLWVLRLKGRIKIPEVVLILLTIVCFALYFYLNYTDVIIGSAGLFGVMGDVGVVEEEPLFNIAEATGLLDVVIRELLLEPVISLTIVLMVLGTVPRSFPGANPAFRWFGNITITLLPTLIWSFVFLKIIPVPNSIIVAFGGVNLAFFAWIFWWLIVALIFAIIGTVIRMLSETGLVG